MLDLGQHYVQSTQHECYLAYQFIESNVMSGVVRFSQKDYKVGGLFNVRFFQVTLSCAVTTYEAVSDVIMAG